MTDSIQGSLHKQNHLEGTVRGRSQLTGSLAVGLLQGKSAYEVAVENGFVGTEEEWLASLKGEKGDKGDKGDLGEQGIRGEKGDKGDSATIQVGTVTTGAEVSITNIGDEHNAVFDFVLPSTTGATEETPGIMKLYNTVGENEDGCMTQKSVTHAINDSASSISAEDLISILV